MTRSGDGSAGGMTRREFLAGAAAGLGVLACRRADGAESRRDAVRVAMVGLGNRSKSLLSECLQYGADVMALCDVDASMLPDPAKRVTAAGGTPRLCGDYRELLNAGDFDAVVIATPDHWHAPLCEAFMRAGKHVFCEKPLTRTVGEARRLRELARRSPVVTQMGNQGSSYDTLRRSVELVKAGALGEVREAHVWFTSQKPRAEMEFEGEDPVPDGFDWDFWQGPALPRPYKSVIYHPSKWRQWWDFGSGTLGDFGCHGFNLPMRALDLGYPDRVEFVTAEPHKDRYVSGSRVTFHFPGRGALAPLAMHWYDGGEVPPGGIVSDLTAVFGKPPWSGSMLVGEKGTIYADCWGAKAIIRLEGEERFRGVLDHEATRDVPVTLPRTENHMAEWLGACAGRGKTFSDFDAGGRLTEITLAGVLALRLGRAIEWDGERLAVRGAPEAGAMIHPEYRRDWVV